MPDYIIPNLRNACRILEWLSRSDQPRSNAEIADQLGIPRSTVLRILTTLEAQQFVRRNGKKFCLGIALIPLGNTASNQHSLREHCLPILSEVTRQTDETCHLVTLTQDKALILQVCDSPHPMSAHSKQGTLADLHCSASGKALLAYLPLEQQQSIVDHLQLSARTTRTITDSAQLTAELQKIRETGYSIDEQEYHEGIRCMAVPVFASDGHVVYSVGITASTSRFTKTRIPSVFKVLKSASAQLANAADLKLKTDF